MEITHQTAILSLVAIMAVSFDATAQSLEALRAARDQARADLVRAQETFDRADEAYIKALGGAALKSAVSPAAAAQPTAAAPLAAAAPPATTVPPLTGQSSPASSSPETRPASEVTFSLSGTGAIELNPLDYRARLIVDDRPTEWTQHASGVKMAVFAGARSLAYEVQNNPTSDVVHPAWKTICQGTLSLKPRSTVEIAIEHGVTCAAK